jgi:hypothetical protein
MKTAFLCIWLLMSFLSFGSSQNLIGILKDEAEGLVRKEMKGFNLDDTKNESFNYLKFINSSGRRTLIIFFSKENISTHTRMMCDFSEFDDIIEELNNKYTRIDKTSWKCSVGTDKFTIKLEEKEWYFVITTKKVIE